MRAAINAARVQPGRGGVEPAKLLALPADGRGLTIAVPAGTMAVDGARWKIDAGTAADGTQKSVFAEIPVILPENPKRFAVLLEGAWTTKDSERVFVARTARFEDADARTRLVFFLTDGYIGNDQAVVEAVYDNARASRVFSFGIGTSVNRFLLDDMARAGRGVSEVVTLAEDADAVVDRLVRRIDAPVLTDLELAIDPALGVRELLPAGGRLPDLYDVEPLVLIGRFDRAARGTITLRGRTGAGAWERTVSVTLPEREPQHDVVPTLWARAKVDGLLLPKLAAVEQDSLDRPTQRAVIRLGEAFHITTPYTSFVAVEKSRVVVGGKPMLVSVPVELPSGTNWNGFFGEGAGVADVMAAETRGARRSAGAVESFGLDLSRIAARQQSDAMNSAPGAAAAPAPVVAASPKPSAPPPPVAPGASIKPRGAQDREILRHGGATGAIEGRRSAEAGEKAKASQGQFGGIPGKRAPGGSQLAPPRQSTGGGFGYAGGGGGVESAARMPATAASAPAAAGAAAADASVTDAAASDAGGRPDSKASLPDAATRDTLVRVLDRRLLILALASVLGEGARIPELASELDLELENGMILVAMKVEATGGKPAASALDALRAAGGVASAEDGARGLVVARVPATGLAALAKGAGVLRIEVLSPSEVPQG
ncbi:MAG: hypothetical protein NTU45_04480, partial [Planctomycetota bacterium]|nr:hypothetical protein [Planctomycetota bacterium]